jgi:hypothetical protein
MIASPAVHVQTVAPLVLFQKVTASSLSTQTLASIAAHVQTVAPLKLSKAN